MPQLANFGLTGDQALGLPVSSNPPIPSLFLASDNGFVVKHTSVEDKVVWADIPVFDHHTPFTLIIYGLASGLCGDVSTYEDCASGGPNTQIVSQDGVLFNTTSIRPDSTPHSPSYFGASSLWGPFGLANLVDPDTGLAYIDARYFVSGSRHDLLRSTDESMTAWTAIFDFFAAGVFDGRTPAASMGAVLADGYLWWIPRDDNKLYRLDLTAFTVTSFAIDWAGNDIQESRFHTLSSPTVRSYTLESHPGTHRLYAYQVFYIARQSDNATKPGPVISIDITDPDVPVMNFTSFEPFGANHTPGDIIPITNTTAIAKVYHVSPENPAFPTFSSSQEYWDLGSIWRTTDAGVTWTQIIADTNLLAAGIDSTVVFGGLKRNSSGFTYQTVVVQDNKIFVAGAAPYVYQSSDQGVTWSSFTIPTNIYTSYLTNPGEVPPYQFTGIALDCRGSGVFPGLAHYPGRNTSPLWGPPLP